jgi:putative acetyltransferase
VDIRPEIRADEAGIDEVHGQAFPNGGVDEIRMVHDLRAGEGYVPELSLVAVEASPRPFGHSQVVGHILVTVVHYVPDEEGAAEVPVLSLAPLAVLPARHDQGIGSRLCDVAIRRASTRPEPFMVVLGHPDYYPRFGFTDAEAMGIRCPFPGVTPGAYMVRRLPGWRPVKTPGTIRYEAT